MIAIGTRTDIFLKKATRQVKAAVSPIIREIQSTTRYQLTPSRRATGLLSKPPRTAVPCSGAVMGHGCCGKATELPPRLRELPRDPAISHMGTHLKELKARSQRDTCTPVFMTALPQQRYRGSPVRRWGMGRQRGPPTQRNAVQPQRGRARRTPRSVEPAAPTGTSAV